QGTAIATALLRTLDPSANGRPTVSPADVRRNTEQLFGSVPARVRLLTAGSPLRQLYARRFPRTYHWFADVAGTGYARGAPPDALPLAVDEWANLYRSGDSVGRGFWTEADPPEAIAPPLDVSAGAGGHLHYFDGTAPALAKRLAGWIVNPP